MRKFAVLITALLLSATGCSSDNTLQGAFEQIMKEDEVENFEVLHLQENETDGLVVAASWSDDYPDRRDEPRILNFQIEDGRWVVRPGTSCTQRGISKVGLYDSGDWVYCGVLKDKWDFEKVKVGNSEATLVKTHGGKIAFVARAADKEQAIVGVYADGTETQVN